MWKRFSFALLAMASLTGSYAQQTGLAADSVSVFTLMEEIEKGTAYQVYTTLSQPFLVKRPLGLTPVDALKESLKGTSWQVNVYGNRIYLMQNLTLQSTLPKAWQQSLTVQEENHPVYVPEVMTSENKVKICKILRTDQRFYQPLRNIRQIRVKSNKFISSFHQKTVLSQTAESNFP